MSSYDDRDLYGGICAARRTTKTFTSTTTFPSELHNLPGEESFYYHRKPTVFAEALADDDHYEFDEEPQEPEVEEEEEEEEDEDEAPMPRRRRFLTESEYQREASDHTKQQLKLSGLYYKHAYHFMCLSWREWFASLRTNFVKVFLAFVVLTIPIVLGLYLATDVPFGQRSDPSMLPDLGGNRGKGYDEEPSRLTGHGSLLNRLLRRAGIVARRDNETAEVLVPAPPLKEATKPSPSPVVVAHPASEEELVAHVGIYEEPGVTFTTLLPSMNGMNIFSFAYSAAVDFFSKTFGWEEPRA